MLYAFINKLFLKKYRFNHYLFLGTLLYFYTASVFSTTILFRDGSMERGEIVDQDQFQIQLKNKEGEIRSISKDEIEKIHYGDYKSPEEEMELKRKEELEIQEREKWAKFYSLGITPLPQELEESQEQVAQATDNPYANTTAGGAFVRSLFIPGWGQFYQGRPVAGSMYFLLALGGGAVYQRQNQIYNNAKDDLSRLENPYSSGALIAGAFGLAPLPTIQEFTTQQFGTSNDIASLLVNQEISPITLQRKAVEDQAQLRDNIGYGLALFWIWNALDAFLFHPGGGNDESVLGFQENLDRGNWWIALDSVPVRSIWDNKPVMEHRVQFTMSF